MKRLRTAEPHCCYSRRSWPRRSNESHSWTPRNVKDDDPISPSEVPELTILMPCLNEAETVGVCVSRGFRFLRRENVRGEVLIADNGSTDRSREVAEQAGARVIEVDERGYGAALRGGIQSARGRYVIMGDADDSYDFEHLGEFLDRLRSGDHLVMGNRFRGGIEPGAMPFLHRRVENPLLSWLGRLFFGVKVGDFHCGLRGFDRRAILQLELHTTGMEFASEVVVASALAGYTISEVPTTLCNDGRSRPPHLRSFRDGWRHLRFLLLYSPRWLFLYPGLTVLAIGLAATVALSIGPIETGSVGFDIGTLLYAAAATVLGYQAMLFALLTRRYGERVGLLPPRQHLNWLKRNVSLERGLVVGILLIVFGLMVAVISFARWRNVGFGALDGARTVRIAVPATIGLILGVQTIFASLFWSIIGIKTER